MADEPVEYVRVRCRRAPRHELTLIAADAEAGDRGLYQACDITGRNRRAYLLDDRTSIDRKVVRIARVGVDERRAEYHVAERHVDDLIHALQADVYGDHLIRSIAIVATGLSVQIDICSEHAHYGDEDADKCATTGRFT